MTHNIYPCGNAPTAAVSDELAEPKTTNATITAKAVGAGNHNNKPQTECDCTCERNGMDGDEIKGAPCPETASGMTPARVKSFSAHLRETDPELYRRWRDFQNARYRAAYDPEKERERRARTRDPQKEEERKREWANAHREERAAYMKRWRAANKDRNRVYRARYYAKKRAEKIAAGWTPKPRRVFATEKERMEAKRAYRRAYYAAHRPASATPRKRLTPEERRRRINEARRLWYRFLSDEQMEKMRENEVRRRKRIYADEERHLAFLRKRAEQPSRKERRRGEYRPKPSRMIHAWDRFCEAYAPTSAPQAVAFYAGQSKTGTGDK